MIAIRRWLSLCAAFVLLLTIPRFAAAQSLDFEYYPESGHNIEGDFLSYYQSVPNPELVFGYPITEQFTDNSGMLVQYFQRARFEMHPELPGGQRVKLTPLGNLTYQPAAQLVINNQFACRTFEETGYSVCFAFLDFFDENGGIAQFGFPISPFEFQNNMIVQYFQNARMEWRPWLGEGLRVGLADLGRLYFDELGLDPALTRAAEPLDSRIKTVLDLQVRAFALKAITPATDTQSVYILVQDQNLQPVQNAQCAVTVVLPNGQSQTGLFTSNENGICVLAFQFRDQPNGKLVVINVNVTYENGAEGTISGRTVTSFRIWY